MESKKYRRGASRYRGGTTAIEMAFIMPVSFLFLFAIFEFGHAMMVRAAIVSTAKDAARMGAIGDTTTQEVRDYIAARLSKVFAADEATVLLKDAAIFDDPDSGAEPVDASTLQNIELSDAESRQPFIIHIEVPYEAVALMPPFWTTGLVISGDSVVRHE